MVGAIVLTIVGAMVLALVGAIALRVGAIGSDDGRCERSHECQFDWAGLSVHQVGAVGS
jgi:hypothetical protein